MNMMTAGNWYSIWSLCGVIEHYIDGHTTQTPYNEVIISDDDKTRSYKVECSSKEEAESIMKSIADDLRRAQLPLWNILGIPKETLSQRMLDYELLRLKYYRIAH
jgi:hypothetical protein